MQIQTNGKSSTTRGMKIRKRCYQFISLVPTLPAYGIIHAPLVVFMVSRFGVIAWTIDNALKTLRLGAIYFGDGETKT